MGGKTWSRAEELCFWNVIIPQSPKAVNRSERVNDWEDCTRIMHRRMGQGARRKYTKLMLFEHYFQNVQTGHRSPCAHEFVTAHKKQLEAENTRTREVLLRSSTLTTAPAVAVQPSRVASSITESQPDFFAFKTPSMMACHHIDDTGAEEGFAAPYPDMHIGESHIVGPPIVPAADTHLHSLFPTPELMNNEQAQAHHETNGGFSTLSSSDEVLIFNNVDWTPPTGALLSNSTTMSSNISPAVPSDISPVQSSDTITNESEPIEERGEPVQTEVSEAADENDVGPQIWIETCE